MKKNWYLVLELEFDPNPVQDEAIISQKIEEKRKFWSSKANDFNHGALYKSYSQMLPEIKKDMIGPNNIRAELIKDACEQTYGPVDKNLKMMKKTEIAEDIIEKMATKFKVDVEAVKRRAEHLGMKVVASENFDKVYDKYYKNKPQNADKFNGMLPLLKSFNANDLYEFLYAGTVIKDPQNLPCDALRKRAKERKSKEFYKTDSVSGSGSKLCGQCDECFKDDTAKKVYDNYLEYSSRKKILDELNDFYDVSKELSTEVYSDSFAQLTSIFKNSTEAKKLLIAFCKIKGIPIPNEGNEKQNPAHMKICRCGCINDISDGRKVCKACGLELELKCPKCKTVNDATIKVCKCGFKFENIDKALSLSDLALSFLEILDFKTAEFYIEDAEKYWPGLEKVVQIKEKYKEIKSRIGTTIADMQNACKKKNYFEARKLLGNIKKLSKGYSNPEIEEEINIGIVTAEKYKALAQKEKEETNIINACIKAYEVCNDCPGIKEILTKYPPVSPTNLKIVTNPTSKINVISWSKSDTEGLLYYSVVRKKDAIPSSVQDGTLVGRVSMTSLNDHNVVPGVQYFYAVFAERAGVYSKGLASKEGVSNLFEISGVKIVSGDRMIQLNWNPIADNASVNIERKDSLGKITKLECSSRNNFIDKNLENEKEYQYIISLRYLIGIKKMDTKGVRISGIPSCPPLPVNKLIIKPTQGKEFKIEWENPGNSETQFFYSTKKPELLSGDIVSISMLESSMNSLLVNKTSKTSGTFKYDGETLIYVVAVSVKSGTAVIGVISRASREESVRVNSANIVNGKIMIRTEFPKNATGFVVLFRHDQFPDDLSDTNTVRKYIPLKQYQYDGGLIIDSNESKNYYFSIFAEFRRDGESDYSSGTDYYFSNQSKEIITYSISSKKQLFGGRTVKILFESENKNFRLPNIDIISAQDRAPMFKKTGNLFYQIPSQEVDGNVSITIPIEKGLPRETYIKPFLQDETLSSNCILKIKTGSEHKIS